MKSSFRVRKRSGVLVSAATLMAVGLTAPSARAAETQVNTYTDLFQALPRVAMNNSGSFVITWQSTGQDNADGNDGIYAQRYDSAGAPAGGEFLVNTETLDDQQKPVVAMDNAGNFVIAWESPLQDGSGEGIFAQRFNSAGVAQGGEFQVNTYTLESQAAPSVAMDADGDFVIVWESEDQDGDGKGIYGQYYNKDGTTRGTEFRANATTARGQSLPAVAMDDAGNFAVAWESNNQDGSGRGIYAQRFDNTAVAQGGEFRVNTTTANAQTFPSVAMDADGDFTIAWTSDLQDGSLRGIYAQRYNSSGVAQGSEFRVNTTTTDDQAVPRVAMADDGKTAITWTSANQDGSGLGVYAQRYSSAGAAIGSEFRVNTTTDGDQAAPDAALNTSGNLVITWTGFDTSLTGVFADRFAFSNEAPTTKNGSEYTFEDTPVSFNLSGRDEDRNPLTYSIVSGPQNGTISGTAPDNLVYTPAPNFNGVDSLTFKANDGTADSNISTVRFFVSAVNDAPVASNTSATVVSGKSVYITLPATDVDNKQLTYAVVGTPQNGTLSGSGNIRLYTPNAGFVGNDSFTFKANDGSLDSNVATVSITVDAAPPGPNTAPVARNQFIALQEDVPTSITLSAGDAEGNALTYNIVSPPTKGTLSGSGANLIYTPNPNVSGSDSFTFQANDGQANSNVARIALAIAAVNDAPVAGDTSASTRPGKAISIALPVSDVDNKQLSYILVSSPQNGSVTVSGSSARYTPNAGFVGSDSFTFKANDGSLDSNTATVSVDVQ